MKDVSCDADIEKQRVKIIQGSNLKLFNANTETLLDSLIAGYHGYNGVMGNFHIEIYKWLFNNFNNDLIAARELQNELTRVSQIESMGYPINAKYHMQQEGVDISIFSRRLSSDEFTEEKRLEVYKLISWEKDMRSKLHI